MLTATYHKSSKSLTYWTKGNQLKRDYCESQVVAKLKVIEIKLHEKINQKLYIER